MKGLKPGMSAEVRIVTNRMTQVLQVPTTAILGTGKERYCFVKSDKELQRRRVDVSVSGDQSIEIKEGVKEGEQGLRDPPSLVRRLAPLLDDAAKPPARKEE